MRGTLHAPGFRLPEGDFHPILALPSKTPAARDPLRWSRTATCYQLKAAMAWHDLSQATGDPAFMEPYDRVLAASLAGYRDFLPGHPDRLKVMDRLHAFCYFLEGLLPRASHPPCGAALREGISLAQSHLCDIAGEFARSDVYAQLLRVRLYADWLGAVPLDLGSASQEAAELASFQHVATVPADPLVDGGYWFGRKDGALLRYINPVSAAFACQALHLWENRADATQADRHQLI